MQSTGGESINKLSIKSFGAIGDGITNDTTSFTNAYSSLPAGGGSISIPAGIYKIDSFPTGKSIKWIIDPDVTFNGTGYPSMMTNHGQIPVGDYEISYTDIYSPIVNGGVATRSIEMIQKEGVLGVGGNPAQSVALYVGTRAKSTTTTANSWCINPVMYVEANVLGTHQAIEVDVNNFSTLAMVKGLTFTGLGSANPECAIDIQRANTTNWKTGIKISNFLVGVKFYGNNPLNVSLFEFRNNDESNVTTKGMSSRYFGRSHNTPAEKEVLVIEVNPSDSDWINTRYTSSIRVADTLRSIMEFKFTGFFLGLDVINQNHIIRQGIGGTQFRRVVGAYVEILTDNTWNAINSVGIAMRVGTTDAFPTSIFAGGLEGIRVNNVNGYVGIGAITANTRLDVNGTVRVTGRTNSTTGVGIEMSYAGGVGTIYTYNNSTGYVDLQLNSKLFCKSNTNVFIGKVSGNSIFGITGLPSSSAGLVTGDIWSNAGVLTVV